MVITEQLDEPETISQAGPHISDSHNETAVSMAPSRRADSHFITISNAQNKSAPGAAAPRSAEAAAAQPHHSPSSKHENGPAAEPGSQVGARCESQRLEGLSGHEADSMELRKIWQPSQRRPGASHMTLPFEPMVLTFQDVRYIVSNQAVRHCRVMDTVTLSLASVHPALQTLSSLASAGIVESVRQWCFLLISATCFLCTCHGWWHACP